MQSINQIWPSVAGKRNLGNVIFILLLTLPCKFWLLAGEWWRAIPCDQGPEADCKEACCDFSVFYFKKWISHSKNQLSSDSFFYVHNYIVIEPKSWSERSIKGNRDHCKSQNHSLSPIHTWTPKNCLLPARSWFSVVFPKEWILSMIFLLLCKETSHFRNPKYFWLLPTRSYVANN